MLRLALQAMQRSLQSKEIEHEHYEPALL